MNHRPPIATAAPVASEALTSANRSARDDVDAARRGGVGPEADQIERRGSVANIPNATIRIGSAARIGA